MPEIHNEDKSVQQAGAIISPGLSTNKLQIFPAASDSSQSPQPVAAQSDIPSQPVLDYQEAQNNTGQNNQDNSEATNQLGGISWTASEYVGHHKSPGWYAAFGAVVIVIIGIVYFITRDITAVAALTIGAVILAVYAGRPPQDQLYQMDEEGFSIGQKRYEFAQFKSFSVVSEGKLSSIIFSPLKRFAPLTTIYFPPNQEDQVSSYPERVIPFEEFKHDAVDRLMRQIRF